MGYVLVKANGANTSGGVGMGYNTQGGLSPTLFVGGTGRYDSEAAAKKYGKNAAAAGAPWAHLGEMAAYGGALYGGLNALNDSLASGQGGGLLSDVGMGGYGGYATLSPLSGWAGNRVARRFGEKERADQEKEGGQRAAEINQEIADQADYRRQHAVDTQAWNYAMYQEEQRRQEAQGQYHSNAVEEMMAAGRDPYDPMNVAAYRALPSHTEAMTGGNRFVGGPAPGYEEHRANLLRPTPGSANSTQRTLPEGRQTAPTPRGPALLDPTNSRHVGVMNYNTSGPPSSSPPPEGEVHQQIVDELAEQRKLSDY